MRRVSCCNGLPEGSYAIAGTKPDGEREYGEGYSEIRDHIVARAAWYKWDSWPEPEMRYQFNLDPSLGIGTILVVKPWWGDEWLDKAEGILEAAYEQHKATLTAVHEWEDLPGIKATT